MADSTVSWDKAHQEAEMLLPWYATGRLDDRDQAMVDRHLSACAECREQLGAERKLIQEFRAYAPELESGWARMRARVLPGATRPARSVANAATELWAAFTRPVVVALAAAQVAFLGLASAILLWLSQPAYQALGSAPVPAAANAIVMFSPDATDKDIRNAMATAGARIVDGPTSAGAYLLHVDPQRRPAALAKLRGDGRVRLAEQIDASKSS